MATNFTSLVKQSFGSISELSSKDIEMELLWPFLYEASDFRLLLLSLASFFLLILLEDSSLRKLLKVFLLLLFTLIERGAIWLEEDGAVSSLSESLMSLPTFLGICLKNFQMMDRKYFMMACLF